MFKYDLLDAPRWCYHMLSSRLFRIPKDWISIFLGENIEIRWQWIDLPRFSLHWSASQQQKRVSWREGSFGVTQETFVCFARVSKPFHPKTYENAPASPRKWKEPKGNGKTDELLTMNLKLDTFADWRRDRVGCDAEVDAHLGSGDFR